MSLPLISDTQPTFQAVIIIIPETVSMINQEINAIIYRQVSAAPWGTGEFAAGFATEHSVFIVENHKYMPKFIGFGVR